MGIELTDMFMTLKPRKQWRRARSQAELTTFIEGARRTGAERVLGARLADGWKRYFAWETVITGAGALILVLAADTAVEYVRPSIRSIFGYDPLDFVGTRLLAYVDDDDRALFEPALARLLARAPETSEALEFRVRHRDGHIRFDENGGRGPNYEPNSFGGPVEDRHYRDAAWDIGLAHPDLDRPAGGARGHQSDEVDRRHQDDEAADGADPGQDGGIGPGAECALDVGAEVDLGQRHQVGGDARAAGVRAELLR